MPGKHNAGGCKCCGEPTTPDDGCGLCLTGTVPSQIEITLSGMTGTGIGGCACCDDINGTFVLDWGVGAYTCLARVFFESCFYVTYTGWLCPGDVGYPTSGSYLAYWQLHLIDNGDDTITVRVNLVVWSDNAPFGTQEAWSYVWEKVIAEPLIDCTADLNTLEIDYVSVSCNIVPAYRMSDQPCDATGTQLNIYMIA